MLALLNTYGWYIVAFWGGFVCSWLVMKLFLLQRCYDWSLDVMVNYIRNYCGENGFSEDAGRDGIVVNQRIRYCLVLLYYGGLEAILMIIAFDTAKTHYNLSSYCMAAVIGMFLRSLIAFWSENRFQAYIFRFIGVGEKKELLFEVLCLGETSPESESAEGEKRQLSHFDSSDQVRGVFSKGEIIAVLKPPTEDGVFYDWIY